MMEVIDEYEKTWKLKNVITQLISSYIQKPNAGIAEALMRKKRK